MYCSKCGKEVENGTFICPNCGLLIESSKTVADTVDGGLIVLSLLIPLIGIILWVSKHREIPKAARSYGIVGIVSIPLRLLLLSLILSFIG